MTLDEISLILQANQHRFYRHVQLLLLAIAAPELSQPEALMIAELFPNLVLDSKDLGYGDCKRVFLYRIVSAKS